MSSKSDDELKSSRAVSGGSLKSKPTWRDTCGCSAASVFFGGPPSAEAPSLPDRPRGLAIVMDPLSMALIGKEVRHVDDNGKGIRTPW
jgi:hypothetical protein